MIKPVVLILVAALGLVAAAPLEGSYARQAVQIWDRLVTGDSVSPVASPVVMISPDGRSRAVATWGRKDELVAIATSGRIGQRRFVIGPGVGSELLWSPDSRAFLVSTSDGGRNGPYRTLVISQGPRGPLMQDLTPLVLRRFGAPVKCAWPELPNVGAIRWSADGRSVVLAAEIVHHSNCDSFGTFRAYEIDWRALKILREFDQLQAKRRFAADLGEELRQAPDECIATPRACWLPDNHPELAARPR